MGKYQRGAAFERDLIGLFWVKGWAATRAAGSGTRPEPVPDVIALKKGKSIVVEAKSTKNDRLSLKTAIKQLERFHTTSGGSAYIAVRFIRKKPRFYPLEKLLKKNNYTIKISDEYMEIEEVCKDE